jgi:hypothetical protein
VSYQTAEGHVPAHTEIVSSHDSPIWNHEHGTRLSKELLQQNDKVSWNIPFIALF